uniref:Uncharacterized protein n=1 Tax=Panagrolaimus sp. PS1159 TaxID=55785 RepID=A0AC35GPY8_9BILA
MWWSCSRETTRGMYEVTNQPLSGEPDPEAGIANSKRSDEASGQPLLTAFVSRGSIKAKTPPKVDALPKSNSSEENGEMSSESFPSQRWPVIFNSKDTAYDELTPAPAQAPSSTYAASGLN